MILDFEKAQGRLLGFMRAARRAGRRPSASRASVPRVLRESGLSSSDAGEVWVAPTHNGVVPCCAGPRSPRSPTSGPRRELDHIFVKKQIANMQVISGSSSVAGVAELASKSAWSPGPRRAKAFKAARLLGGACSTRRWRAPPKGV